MDRAFIRESEVPCDYDLFIDGEWYMTGSWEECSDALERWARMEYFDPDTDAQEELDYDKDWSEDYDT